MDQAIERKSGHRRTGNQEYVTDWRVAFAVAGVLIVLVAVPLLGYISKRKVLGHIRRSYDRATGRGASALLEYRRRRTRIVLPVNDGRVARTPLGAGR